MAHRAPKRPRVSVIMAVQDADATLSRAVESVLSQSLTDVQLVISVMPSRDRTLQSAERWAERDIRVDVVDCPRDERAAAYDAGIDAARGSYVLFMGEGDWLGTGMLDKLVGMADAHDLELGAAALVRDGADDSSSRVIGPRDSAHALLLSASEVRSEAYRFIESDAFGTLRGKMLVRERVARLGLRMVVAQDEEAYLISYLEDIARVGVQEEVRFHLAASAGKGAFAAEDGYARCERDHARLLELASRWGMSDDHALMQAIHRRHLRHVIECIFQACAHRQVSSIERSDRIRDMVEAPSTQETICVLRDSDRLHRDFGLMFEPIAHKNVAACCLSARVSELIRAPQLSFLTRNVAAW